MKHILIIILALMLSVAVIPIAQADCPEDLQACEQLMDEIECLDCEKVCEDKCGWVALMKDEKFMAAVISGVILLIGGVAGIFITGGG